MVKLSTELINEAGRGRYLWQVPASPDRSPRSAENCAIEKHRSVGCMTHGFPMNKPVPTHGLPRLVLSPKAMSTRVTRRLCILNEIERCPDAFDIFDSRYV